MTSSLTYASPMYYRHSGQFSAVGLLMAIFGSLIAAIILAAVYAYVDLYCPIVYVNFIATVVFGVAVGGVAGYLLRWGHVRNAQMTLALGIGVAIVALYASWVFWIYALLQKATSSVAPFNLLELGFRPDRVWLLISQISQVGTWSVGHLGSSQTAEAVHGPWLWGVWLIEAGLIVVLSVSTTRRLGSALPYCEMCQQWCGAGKRLFSTPPGDAATLKDRLEAKDFGFLISLGPDKKPLPSNWFEVYLYSCEKCRLLYALTINAVRLETDRKGKQQKKERIVIDKLLLTAKELQTLQLMKEQYAARLAQPKDASQTREPAEAADAKGPDSSAAAVKDTDVQQPA